METSAPLHHFEVASIVSQRTRRGMIEITFDAHHMQVDLDKAREIVGLLQGAIEAAVTDELLLKFLTDRIGMPLDAAGRALLDFRELRQGTKGTVYPS